MGMILVSLSIWSIIIISIAMSYIYVNALVRKRLHISPPQIVSHEDNHRQRNGFRTSCIGGYFETKIYIWNTLSTLTFVNDTVYNLSQPA